jgi:hypothetical protein
MTKTEMRRIARDAIRYGHHVIDGGATEAWASCPLCRERVIAYKLPWERFTLAKWERAFIDHLTDH